MFPIFRWILCFRRTFPFVNRFSSWIRKMLRLGRLRCSFCTEIHRQPLRFSLSTSLEARAGGTTTKVRSKFLFYLVFCLLCASLGMLRLSSTLLLSEASPPGVGPRFRPENLQNNIYLRPRISYCFFLRIWVLFSFWIDFYRQCCGSGIFILDPAFFHPGSELFPSRIRIKEFKYFNQKKWFLSSRKYDPGCSSQIPTFCPSRISDPGVKKAPDPGSGSTTLYTRY